MTLIPPVGMKHENIIKVKYIALRALTVHPKPPASPRLREEIKKHFGFAPPLPQEFNVEGLGVNQNKK